MHYPVAIIMLVAATPLLGIAAGVVGALLWRARVSRNGVHVTAARSVISVFNGVAIGLTGGVLTYLILAAALPHPA